MDLKDRIFFLLTDFFPKLSELYDVKDVSVFNIRNNYFIASEYTGGKLAIKPKLGKYL